VLAQDILARGDWLWPRLNGVGYYNKPPLLAWLIALCSWPLGQVTQWTAVVPSALAGVATVLIVYGLGRDLFGPEAGGFAALVATTTQGLFVHAHLALPDILMTCFITASLWTLARMTRERPNAWIGFYGFAGLAFWAKGPAGLLPLAIALVYGLATRSRRAWSLRLAPGLPLVGVAVGLWWFLGMLSSSQAMAQAVVTDQLAWYRPQAPSLAAITAPLRNSFGVLFPWVLLLPLALPSVLRRREDGPTRDGLFLVLVWAGVTLALIALSTQQRVRYYVPIVPPVALLIGWWLSDAMARRRRIEVPWRLPLAVALVLAGATLAAVVSSRRLSRSLLDALPASPVLDAALLGGLALIAVALVLAVRHDGLRGAVAAMWVGGALWLVAGDYWEIERHARAGDYASLASQLSPLLGDSPLVVAWGIPELPLAFYAGRRVVSVDSSGELRLVITHEPLTATVATLANWTDLAEGDRLTVVARNRLASREVVLVRRPAAS
jgi:4-amino-4-deoxy-L-arabinose transferase-like glycosyltransferase